MEQLYGGVVTVGLAELSTAVHQYLGSVIDGELMRVSDADVLDEVRALEVLRRRLAVADHALVGELDRRGVAGQLVTSSTLAVLQGLLRISPDEAKNRVAAARACGSRTSLTGEPLPVLLPVLAAAQADGLVSAEHTRTVLAALDDLPATVSVDDRTLAHDALEDLAGLAVRRNEPTESGAPAQVIITMTADQLSIRRGLAQTSFGQQLSIDQALKLADEAALNLLLADATGAVLSHRRTKRIATRPQTLALIARDKGCSFPGCDKPPEWCQLSFPGFGGHQGVGGVGLMISYWAGVR